MTLIYTLSTQIRVYREDRQLEVLFDFYKVSMIRARRFGHKVKFYGCERAIKELDGYYDECVDVSDIHFILTDDLKIYVHQIEPLGVVTIDGDLILNEALKIDETSDVVFDMRESPRHLREFYSPSIQFFRQFELDKRLDFFNHNHYWACNVGIMWFRTHEIRDLYLECYRHARNFYIQDVLPNPRPPKVSAAIILCQQYFSSITEMNDINVSFASKYNDYKHYVGGDKFKTNPLELESIPSSQVKRNII